MTSNDWLLWTQFFAPARETPFKTLLKLRVRSGFLVLGDEAAGWVYGVFIHAYCSEH
jgi:hypothetical protein